ncbi:MAG: exodeoxyribonuclease VII large subunit [Clostridiales bacterium]|nr:exodeoxyribonuclease VII large subunit [Clostridiales bacterium]
MNLATLSVGQLNEYVRRVLASDPMLRYVCVVGEISNLKRHVSGHWYFSLKDEEAAVNCAMFRQAAMSLRFRPENGMRVRLYGNVSLYTKTGSYQFYVENMEQEGLGALYLRFEALKNRLMQEGLFDASLKKPLPAHVSGIGVVTSKTGAVVHDIARVAWRRDPSVQLYLCPASVQGENAAAEIVSAIKLLDHFSPAEVIIVGRGGGSMEDLWPFNEEKVARAIAACKKPVISAVGHETDFTIADFVADLRAPTPSAAAELAVQRQDQLTQRLASLRHQMDVALDKRFSSYQMQLMQLRQRLTRVSPEERTQQQLSRVEQLRLRMQTACENTLHHKEKQLAAVQPALDQLCDRKLRTLEQRLSQATLLLRTTGPMETIRRGYAVVMKDGMAVRDAHQLVAGDEVSIRMNNGIASATIHTVQKGS